MRCPFCDHPLDETPQVGDLCPACGSELRQVQSTTVLAEGPGPSESEPSAPSSDSSIDGARFIAGKVIAERYRIIGMLGRGGMGEVYRAEDLKLGEPVALKFLPVRLAQDGAALARFHREVRLARQITHPNVCRVFDISEDDGVPFLTMEYIDGEDLASLLRRIGRLPVEKALELARQVCAGLSAAHQRGVLHRDLKPANVMIDGKGQAKITDFGLADLVKDTGRPEEIVGTPAYMAPEQLFGGRLAASSDLYSLALVIYEMLTGRRLFAKMGVYERLKRLRQGPLKVTIEGVDRDLEKILVGCLELEPEDRPASVFEVEAALAGGDPLAAAMRAGELPSPEMVARAGREGSLEKRRATIWLGVFIVALLASILLAERTTDLGRADLQLSPEVLADRARTLLSDLGWSAEGDRAWALTYDSERRDEAVPFAFWYRQSPRPLAPAGRWSHRPTATDPPLAVPGMVSVELEADGRLRRLRSLPSTQGQAVQSPWASLFELTGLPTDLESTAPRDVPPAFADERRAWIGSIDGEEVRLEAASWRGLLVYLEIHRGVDQESVPLQSTGWWIMLNTVFLLLWFGSLLILRSNLRAASGDTEGAQRLFLVAVVASLAAWVLEAHHTLDGNELQLFFGRLAAALMRGGILWLLYMALEPTVRRLWPDKLVSWTRLLSGRFQDPLVGRHLLQGMTLYLSFHVVALAGDATALHFGWAGPRTIQNLDPKLAGGWQAIAFFIERMSWLPVLSALAVLFLLARLRVLVRRDVVAAVLLGVFLFAVSNADPAVTPLAAAAWAGTVAFAALRWGLVAVLGVGLMVVLVVFCPLTTDLGRWYSTTTVLGVGTALLLGVWSYRRALGAAGTESAIV